MKLQKVINPRPGQQLQCINCGKMIPAEFAYADLHGTAYHAYYHRDCVGDYRLIEKANHLAALEELGFKPSAFNRLRTLEHQAHYLAELYCDGNIIDSQYIPAQAKIESAVHKLCSKKLRGFFINGDPRGYALKIDMLKIADAPTGLHRDWGNYGILAPEF